MGKKQMKPKEKKHRKNNKRAHKQRSIIEVGIL